MAAEVEGASVFAHFFICLFLSFPPFCMVLLLFGSGPWVPLFLSFPPVVVPLWFLCEVVVIVFLFCDIQKSGPGPD